jgi:hypothetical protein
MVAAPWTFVSAQPAAVDVPIRVESGLPPERAQQLAETARHALTLLSAWLGPYPTPSLTIVDASWRAPSLASPQATAAVAMRWIELQRDPAAERRLIASIASHFWHEALSAPPERRWFAEALARYLAARAIDTILEGRQYWSSRYFGGFIPFAVPALPLSPFGADARGHVLSFDADMALPADSDPHRVTRAIVALFTLERVIGWPSLQQGLMALRMRAVDDGGHTPSALNAVLSAQRGSELGWFFDEAFRADNQFDYAVDSVTNAPDGARFHVRVMLRRVGDGVFGVADGSRGPALPVVVEFADRSTIVDRWHGGRASLSLEYTAAAPAVRATLDPDAMLLLDRDPVNNVERLTAAPITSVGMRATMAWLTWAEGLVLTCLALV